MTPNKMIRYLLGGLLVIAFGTVVVNYYLFKSLQGQYIVAQDKGVYALSIQEVNKLLPPFPNVGVASMPLDVYRASYAIVNGDFENAKKLIDQAVEINPHTYVGEYLKSKLYLAQGELDSARINASKSFYGWPKNIEHYNTYYKVLVAQKDTLEMIQAFDYLTPALKEKPAYFNTFYKSFNEAKISYLITDYPDATEISQDLIIGKWIRVYNFPNNQSIKDSTNTYVFKKNGALLNPQKLTYLYQKKEDSLFLYFKNNTKTPITKLGIRYSPSYKTLILSGIPTQDGSQDQFFKKILSKAVK